MRLGDKGRRDTKILKNKNRFGGKGRRDTQRAIRKRFGDEGRRETKI